MKRPLRSLPPLGLAALHLPGLFVPEPPAAFVVGLLHFLLCAAIELLRK